ncbi:hypothetical protein AX23_15305 [Brucella melitensis 548]|nr:hypothetical protein AX23_15305 [Brucella melitensis 548]
MMLAIGIGTLSSAAWLAGGAAARSVLTIGAI